MSLRMNAALSLLFGLAVAAQGAAGTFFRLEVGPPAAAGINAKVKKAALVVRSRLCTDEASVRISGTAEGVVNGARQSIVLDLVSLPAAGQYAIQRQWPDEGQWIVHLTGTCPATRATTSAIVPMTKAGFVRAKTQVLPEVATRAQIEAALTDHARSQS